MDVRARDLLSKIREIPEASNAIIAGGAARDDLLGKEPRDYDFFLPRSTIGQVVVKLDFKKPPVSKGREYPSRIIRSVYDLDYEGISCQLVDTNIENNENFPQKIVEDFDYGICMVWFEGSSVLRDTEEFRYDRNNGCLTLRKLDTVSSLPKAMTRFFKMDEKLGPGYTFKCPILSLEKVKPAPEEEKPYFKSKVIPALDDIDMAGLMGIRDVGVWDQRLRPVLPMQPPRVVIDDDNF